MPLNNLYTPSLAEPVEDTITISGRKRKVFLVNVEGEEYKLCDEASHNMASNRKTGHWGGGIINDDSDKRRAERVGRLGEMAFAKVFGVPVDLTYRQRGDDRDLTLLTRIRAEVKTALRRYSYDAGLIRAVSDRGKELPLNCDVYLFAYLEDEDRAAQRATVALVGGVVKNTIKQRPLVEGKNGNHFNYEMPYDKVVESPRILALYRKFEANREAVGYGLNTAPRQ